MATSSGSETSKKSSRSKKSTRLDPDCFNAPGKNFRGKLIGVEDVPEARGDKMCQVAMAKLKAAVRTIGDHKQRIIVNVSLEGIKIIDEKTEEPIHRHLVQRISFIARDVSDTRAFGYVYASAEGRHLFYGIKTEKVADSVVICLRDLFQVVFEMKKREADASKQTYQLDGSLGAGSMQLNSQSSSNCGSAVSDGDDSSLPSDCLVRLEEVNGAEQGLEHLPLSTSPGGSSLPVSGLWDNAAAHGVDDKYNTLPAGSASLYRSMFVSRTVSRSPLAARSGSLRLEQPHSLELQSEPTYIQTTSTPKTSGTLPRVNRARNRSLTATQQRQYSANDAENYAIPPPASVPSTRRLAGSGSVSASQSPTQSVVPVTSTGWAKFDLSPLAENAQDVPQSAAPQTVSMVEEKDAFPSDVFQPDITQVERRSPLSDFANFPTPEVQRKNDNNGDQKAGEAQSKEGNFSDSFVANSFSFDDSFQPTESTAAAASTTLDLMSPSSDRDSLSLPSPEAPPPPLPAEILASLPLEPPVPPPRPRARVSGRYDRSGSLTSSIDVSLFESAQSMSSAAFADQSGGNGEISEKTANPIPIQFSVSNGMNNPQGHIFPFEFPSDDSAPPPPPRPALNRVKMDGYRSLPRPSLSRGVSVPCAPKHTQFTATAPMPPIRKAVESVTPVADNTFELVSSKMSAAKKLRDNRNSSSPIASDSSVTETTVSPLPRPRPQLRTTESIVRDSGAVPENSEKHFDSPTLSFSSPWVPPESQYIDPTVVDPFADVDPFSVSLTPDDPFGESLPDGFLADLSNNFDLASLSAQTFRTRAVTVDSVSSDNFDGDIGHGVEASRSKSTDSRTSDHSFTKIVGSRKPTPAPQSDVGFLIDLNASASNSHHCIDANSSAAVLDSSSTTVAAQIVDSFSSFSDTEVKGSSWITFPGPGEPIPEAESDRGHVVGTSGISGPTLSFNRDVVDAFTVIQSNISISASPTTTVKQTVSAGSQMMNLFPVNDSFA